MDPQWPGWAKNDLPLQPTSLSKYPIPNWTILQKSTFCQFWSIDGTQIHFKLIKIIITCSVVGILLRARKHEFIDFTGEMLWQRQVRDRDFKEDSRFSRSFSNYSYQIYFIKFPILFHQICFIKIFLINDLPSSTSAS